jgi:hypothetical protein
MKYFARSAWIVVGCVAAVLLASTPGGAQDLEEWQQRELLTLQDAVGAVRSGMMAHDEAPIEYLPSYMQGPDESVYVPFTMLIDPSAITTDNLAVLVSLAPPSDAAAPDAEPPDTVFENGFYAEATKMDSGQIRLNSALQAASGEYEIFIAIRDSFDGDAPIESSINPRTGQPVRGPLIPPIVIRRERVSIPDLWNDELALSTVFLGESLQMLSEAPTVEDMVEFPYTVGAIRVVEPRLENTLTKADTLSWVFQIYNPGDDGGMPDITINYEFFTQNDGAETFFNRTAPVVLGDQTLPPGFDVTAAPLGDGQNIPLGGFPAGDYRLEIKITDNERSAELTEDLLFTVTES